MLLCGSWLVVACGPSEPVDKPADASTDAPGVADVPLPPDASSTADVPSCLGAPGCPCQDDGDCPATACLDRKDGSRTCGQPCESHSQCPGGERCVEVLGKKTCVATDLRLCSPCLTAADCKVPGHTGAACLPWDAGQAHCGITCAITADCPFGYVCETRKDVAGSQVQQCVPAPGVGCPCSPLAIREGAKAACLLTNEHGTCGGFRLCTPEGLSGCQGASPAAEACNGQDDDCDGGTDEDVTCDDGSLCTPDECLGPQGCSQHDPVIACDDDNPCTKDVCDPKTGCTHPPIAGCTLSLPYVQTFACDVKPSWSLSPGIAGRPRWTVDAYPSLAFGQPGYHSPGCSLNFNHADSLACQPDGVGVEGTATSPWLDATWKPEAVLVLRLHLAGAWKLGDRLTIETQVQDSQTWSEVALLDPPPGSQWQATEVPLPGLAGLSFRLRLHFVSDDCSTSAGLPGPFVDDIAVRDARCSTDGQCDDDDPCTDDVCVPLTKLCKHKPAAVGTACSDGNPCTGADACKFGLCTGTPKLQGPCDDADPCTTGDTCKYGECTGQATDGAPCSDGNPCTTDDVCTFGDCVGSDKPCDDGQPCTLDLCDVGTGGCAAVAGTEAVACKDGDPCTVMALCHAGKCTPLRGCDDGNPCTLDFCSTGAGTCGYQNVPAGDACTDDNPCTGGDKCQLGQCVGSSQACSVLASDGFGCGQPHAWTLSPAPEGVGPAWAVDASPGVPGLSGCALNFNDGKNFGCAPGQDNVGGQASRTFDLTGAKSATLRLFSYADVGAKPDTGLRWIDVSADGFASPPQTVWLANGPQTNQAWQAVRVDLSAFAGKIVTVRLHFDAAGCDANTTTGWWVDDVAVLTDLAEPCSGPQDCDAAGPCTKATCSGGECSYQHVQTVCDDGNACTVGDKCDGLGGCIPGKAKACDDGNPCTVDSCAPATGCVIAPAKDGSYCTDADPCTSGDVCFEGKCLTRPKCDDGNPCSVDSCAGGVCDAKVAKDGLACSDLDPCTAGDTCTGGICKGVVTPCKTAWQDGLACGSTDWTADPSPATAKVAWAVDASPQPPGFRSAGCSLNLNDGKSTACGTGQARVLAQVVSPEIDLTQVGEAVVRLYHWADVGSTPGQNLRWIEASADGFLTTPVQRWLHNGDTAKTWLPLSLDLTPLKGKKVRIRLRFDSVVCPPSAGKGWFVDDVRVIVPGGKACTGPAACDDGEACTVDLCADGACQHTPGKGDCTDGNACTLYDACGGGACLPGDVTDCDDGNSCTFDACDALLGCKSSPKVDAVPCSDGEDCTLFDTCKNGKCQGKPEADGIYCSDPNTCDYLDTCKAGKCSGGLPMTDGTVCSDGNPCTLLDACKAGKCVGPKAACNDGEPCTLDLCQAKGEESVCVPQPLADGSACADGDPCTQDDACVAGVCDGKPAPCQQLHLNAFDCGKSSGWELDPNLNAVGWNVDGKPYPPGFHSPGCSLNFNNDTDFNSGVAVKGNATSPAVTLLPNAVAGLSFWSWHSGDPSPLVDKRVIEVSTNEFFTVAATYQLDNHQRQDQWSKHYIDLSAFHGKKIRVRFKFDSVDALNNVSPGWFVDDVALRATQPPACDKDADCIQFPTPCLVSKCQAGQCQEVLTTAQCDDGDACTEATVCSAGKCVGTPVNCDDGYACTNDSCHTQYGCSNPLIPGCGVFPLPYEATFTCGDPASTFWLREGDFGGAHWAIDATPGIPVPYSPDCSLNFNNGVDFACKAGQTKVQGTATSPTLDATAFKPGTPLQLRFQMAGSWEAGAADDFSVELWDGKAWATLASYDPLPGWQKVKLDVTPYAGKSFKIRLRFQTTDCLGNAGSGPYVDDLQVVDASCKAASDCDDGNPCTDDGCDVSTGACTATDNTAKCDDNDPCTISDGCGSGKCLGAPKPCDDGNPCTGDVCQGGACVSSPKPDQALCTDGEPCTVSDVCLSATCVGQPKADASACSDGSTCTTGDACQGGVCKGKGTAADGTLCSDGDPCTAGDTCKTGTCAGGKAACDDSDPCTLDACEKVNAVTKKCSFTPIPGCG